MGNLTQNEARPGGAFDFRIKKSVRGTDVVGSPATECMKQSKRARDLKGKSDSAKKEAREKKMTLCLYKRANFADVLNVYGISKYEK